ncbi:MAG: hypothetical protein ACKO96_24995 [Flammeovirgaceae bacterium]
MRVRDWNKFMAAHPSAMLLGAVVSTRLPSSLLFDTFGKKLPTPYKIFCEWLDASLVATWSTVAVPQGFVIGLTDEVDKRIVLAAYGPVRHRGFKIAEKSIGVLSYTDGDFSVLAAKLGYTLNI